MSHRRGKDAVRMAVIAAKQCELAPLPYEVPQDFADTEQDDIYAGVMQPEPVELYTLANPKEQQS